jgi:16S rRNA (guanine966-N2)-methyltransferase
MSGRSFREAALKAEPALKPRREAAPPAPVGAKHQVRIIGGQWRRSLLPVAHKPGLRPTPDRVRETLFNWLPHDLEGWRVLDAFAGTGALGFEAASRGATAVLLLEQDPGLVKSLTDSRTRLKAHTLRVQRADALSHLRAAESLALELILLDPPFGAGLGEPALAAAVRLLVPGGLVYLESGEAPVDIPAGLRQHRQLRAGAVWATLFQKDEAS